MKRVYLLELLIPILCVGCNPLDIQAPGRLETVDLAGIWKLSTDSKKIAQRDGAVDQDLEWIEVRLNQDGTCRLRLYRFDFEPRGRIEGIGKWTIDGRVIKFEMEDRHFYVNESLMVGKTDGVLILYAWHRDPDEFEILKFRRFIGPGNTPVADPAALHQHGGIEVLRDK